MDSTPQLTAARQLSGQWRLLLIGAVTLGLAVLLGWMGSRPHLWIRDVVTLETVGPVLILAGDLLRVAAITTFMLLIRWFSRIVFQPGWMTFVYCIFAWSGGILWWFPVLGLYWAFSQVRRTYIEPEIVTPGGATP